MRESKSDSQVETAADPTRRAVIAGAGVVGASALLAGCGWDTADLKNRYIADGQTTAPAAPPAAPATDGAAPAPTEAAPAQTAAPAGNANVERLASTSDIPVGGGKSFSADKVVVTQPTEGNFKAYDTTCSHAGCAVTKVSDGTINCPCHGAKFSVEDGSVTAGPAPSGLQEVSITVEGDAIQLA
jgi:nitrite reductase/ring-hydroxylating ferredoxin subunit